MLSKYAKTYVNDTLGQFAGQGNKIFEMRNFFPIIWQIQKK
jgi:hypothetical protein